MTITQEKGPEATGPEAAADAEPGLAGLGPGDLAPEPGVAPALFMGLVALLVALDVHLDRDTGATLFHVGLELVTVAIAGGGALALWWQLLSARRSNRALSAHLVLARADAERLSGDVERYRAEAQEHLRGLGEDIDRQFERWALSPAEREVGLLLLKGLSLKEAAEVRSTSERTVRQQALAVYRKAGLAGRAELAAFFLEDLLLPAQPAPGAAAARPATTPPPAPAAPAGRR